MRPTFANRSTDLGRHITIRSAREQRRLLRRLGEDLSRLEEKADRPYVNTLQIQLVIQICGERSYPSWRADLERAWLAKGGKCSTRTWPAALQGGECAAVLLPLRPGLVATTARDHPPLLATPFFTHGRAERRGGYQSGILALLTSWISRPDFDVTARLAPPIVEVIFQRRIAERRVETFGLDWPLPAAPELTSGA